MQTQRLRKMDFLTVKKKAFQKHESSDSHMESGFLSDLKTHIARFPDGEFFRQLAYGEAFSFSRC